MYVNKPVAHGESVTV